MLDVRTLHRHMSSPEWTAAQWESAKLILAGAEQALADALYGTVIEPFLHRETVPVDREGWVATSYPVFSLIMVDGQVATDDATAPGYRVTRHRLYTAAPASGSAPVGVGGPIMGPSDPRLTDYLPGRDLAATAAAPRPDPWVGQVAVEYMAGWGPVPALVSAILDKAADRMSGRHSDTMGVVGVTAQSKNPKRPNEYTDAELAPLGRYRGIGWGNRL